ncbi:Porin B [Pseudomonas fluorescens]|nr:Porin B [Pseudomonas fluorescens]
MPYKGPLDARLKDTLGFGIARVDGSSHLLRYARTANETSGLAYDNAGYVQEQLSMYVAEHNYRVQATRWLSAMPRL